jgi:hypothetical protein
MEGYKSYLRSRRLAAEKEISFYLYWVAEFTGYCRISLGTVPGTDGIERYIRQLARCRTEEQVRQADRAIRLYRSYQQETRDAEVRERAGADAQWDAVSEEMRKMLRLKQRSPWTEQSYLRWIRRFYLFINGRSPLTLQTDHGKAFISHLSVQRRVSPDALEQARHCLAFFFRYVLNKPLGDICGAPGGKS